MSERYEAELNRLGLSGCVLAYRRIPRGSGEGGKCNIDFALDAVRKIRELGECCVVSLDISSYFEHLDHARLKALWCRLLGVSKLPLDHFKVFERITRYSIVDKKEAYARLGHFGAKRKTLNGQPINGYITPYEEVPRHLCSGREFRQIIGDGSIKSIIEKNFKPYGIPQGAPISDLLANLYLIDFDRDVAGWARKIGGAYYRYSDDILIVIPGGEAVGQDMAARVRSHIKNFGSQLIIKEEKSSLHVFHKIGDDQRFDLVKDMQGRNGLEYLGFRYDGKCLYLRDSTLANLLRKIARAARRDANACVSRYPGKDLGYLRRKFNYERLITRFGRVEDFGEKQEDYRNWTFWTYARRAATLFGPLGKPILRQLRRHRELIRLRADTELERAIVRREKKGFP